MDSKRVELRFRDKADSLVRIAVNNPKEGISKEDLTPVIDSITENKAFMSSKGDLIESFEKAVEITVTEREIA